jgi:hypothetical protein
LNARVGQTLMSPSGSIGMVTVHAWTVTRTE